MFGLVLSVKLYIYICVCICCMLKYAEIMKFWGAPLMRSESDPDIFQFASSESDQDLLSSRHLLFHRPFCSPDPNLGNRGQVVSMGCRPDILGVANGGLKLSKMGMYNIMCIQTYILYFFFLMVKINNIILWFAFVQPWGILQLMPTLDRKRYPIVRQTHVK